MTSRSSCRKPSPAAPTPSLADKAYVATWSDWWCRDFGAYKVFREKAACVDYLVEMVFWRARNLRVPVLDLDRCVTKDGRIVHPRLRRDQVTVKLLATKEFALALKVDDDGNPIDLVSVGWCEAEVE